MFGLVDLASVDLVRNLSVSLFGDDWKPDLIVRNIAIFGSFRLNPFG